MSYRESLPAPPLRPWVVAYWGVAESAVLAAPGTRRILPDGCADLICDFSGGHASMRWVGTMTRAIEVPIVARQDLFGIRFAPGGLYPLLGAPMTPLTDGSVAFADLPATAWLPPLSGWLEDGDFAARCARADASLQSLLLQLPGTPMLQLLQGLSASRHLPESAAALADAVGWGMRTLQRRFQEQLGVSPRQHLRYLRFERARQLLAQRGQRAVEVAMAAGYSDQAHFVREFRRFAGITPGRWR